MIIQNIRGNMEEKKTNIHKNHRKRLKSKVKDYGLGCLAYHEVLEFLLTYTIPRKDTNPIGHNLLENFGSFCDVIDADYYDLLKVDGVGPESALFISTLADVMEIYNKSKQERKAQTLNGPGACAKFFRMFYPIKSTEDMLVVGLSANKKVVKICKQKGYNDVSVSVNFKNIINQMSVKNVNSIVLFHTHPHGNVEPSEQDIIATQSILNMCLTNGIDFDDHLILNETQYYSFRQDGMIDKMKFKFNSVFGGSEMFLTKNGKDENEGKK